MWKKTGCFSGHGKKKGVGGPGLLEVEDFVFFAVTETELSDEGGGGRGTKSSVSLRTLGCSGLDGGNIEGRKGKWR